MVYIEYVVSTLMQVKVTTCQGVLQNPMSIKGHFLTSGKMEEVFCFVFLQPQNLELFSQNAASPNSCPGSKGGRSKEPLICRDTPNSPQNLHDSLTTAKN